MRNYSEALDLAKQALETAEQTGDGYLIGQALRTTARCLIVLKRYDEALSVLQRSLSESRALGHALAIAQNLELLGYTQAARMQLFVARAAYRAGQVQYGSMGSTTMGQDGKARCEHNIRELAGGQPTLTELRKPMLF
jgi:tetratricopeptide (TPR) repeat protein